MDVVLEYIFNFFKDESCAFGVLLYVVALVTLFIFLFQIKSWNVGKYVSIKRYRICFALLILGHLILIFESTGENVGNVGWFVCVICNLLFDVGIFVYLHLEYVLFKKKIDRVSDSNNGDLIAIYNELQKIDVKKLTPKELVLWKKRYYWILFMLGSINKSIEVMHEVEEEGSSAFFMLNALRLEAKGDMQGSLEELQKAVDALQPDSSELDYVQIYNNFGRIWKINGNATEALHYYIYAVDKLTRKSDKYVVHITYSNLIIQTCIVGASLDEVERLIDEYETYIDKSSVNDVIELANTKLEVARQLGDNDLAASYVSVFFDKTWDLLQASSDAKQKYIYLISVIKQAHWFGLDVQKYFDILSNHLDEIMDIRMPERYYINKDIFLEEINMPKFPLSFIQRNQKVFDSARSYMLESAEEDLDIYLNTLPDVAIYAYAHTLEEMVWLKKLKKDKYDFQWVHRKMMEISEGYEQKGLLLESVISRGKLLDEMLFIPNVDKDDYSLLYPNETKRLLNDLNDVIGSMKYHPSCAELMMKAAYGYMRLDDYKKCDKLYHKFLKCGIKEEHFPPWTQANIEMLRLISKLRLIEKSIRNIKSDNKYMGRLTLKAKQWILRYPNIQSQEIVLLLGMLLEQSEIVAKVASRVENRGDGSCITNSHGWLCYYTEVQLTKENNYVVEIDLLYRYKDEADNKKRMVFVPGTHPLQFGSNHYKLRTGVKDSAMEHIYELYDILKQVIG